MALLKRIKAASLVETLTASVLIILVFMIASLSFNNVFSNTIKADGHLLQNRVRELKYFAEKGKLVFPFNEDQEYWTISGQKLEETYILQVYNKRQGREYQVEIHPE